MRNIVFQNNIIEPSEELVPCIRISPFGRVSVQQRSLSKADLPQVFGKNIYIMPKGRTAINEALRQYDLRTNDVVTIFTTSGNFYISGCVTKEIEKFCLWSHEMTPSTKLIFVNHEFGYPFMDLSSLKQYNLPIIEDRAHAFFSQNQDIGTIGDYVIYSLPKAFSMQMGGVLQANVNPRYEITKYPDAEQYVMSHLSNQLERIETYKEKRMANYVYLKNKLNEIDITPFFALENCVVPGVFLFRWKDTIDYQQLKIFMQAHGVESSVFYGQKAFFIPCHHNLSKAEMDYMIALLVYFYKNQNYES